MSALILHYRRSDGALTTYELRQEWLCPSPDGFDAELPSGQMRSFAWKRVRYAVFVETGEVLEVDNLYKHLHPGAQIPTALDHLRALPLAYALMTFARQVRGRLGARERAIIVSALSKRLGPTDLDAAQLEVFICAQLPDAHRLYEPVGMLAAELSPMDRAIAFEAASSMSSRYRVEGSAEAMLISKLYA